MTGTLTVFIHLNSVQIKLSFQFCNKSVLEWEKMMMRCIVFKCHIHLIMVEER